MKLEDLDLKNMYREKLKIQNNEYVKILNEKLDSMIKRKIIIKQKEGWIIDTFLKREAVMIMTETLKMFPDLRYYYKKNNAMFEVGDELINNSLDARIICKNPIE